MAFTTRVSIDGANLSPIALEGATITYGRRTMFDQPVVPVAVVSILTRDAYPSAADDYPEFGLGDWASDLSGFTDDYADVFAGSRSRITIGVPVVIGVDTPSGFTDDYVDEYASGVNYTRFTGRVNSIDYTPGVIQITATPRSEDWGRILVGETGTGETIPVETEAARAVRLAAEGGIELVVDGAPTVEVNAIPEATAPTPLMDQLLSLMRSTGGTVFTDREGYIHVRTRAYSSPVVEPVELPPAVTMIDPLRMSLDLGLVRNRVTIEYGPTDVNPRAAVTVEDSESIARYGLRDYRVSSPIENLDDATALANDYLTLLSPTWTMPSAEAALALAEDATISALCELQMGQRVLLPSLLLGAPDPTYEAELLGVDETLSRTDWRVTLHLSPQLAAPTF